MVLQARSAPRPGPKDYNSEFRELGLDAVRKELRLRRWQPEKLAVARVWVESQDTHSWVAGRKDVPPVDRRKNRPWWLVYLIGASLLAFGAVRLIQKLF